MPRFLGYAFNPISIFHCYDKNNYLKVIILEVNNTFGEKHLYVLKRNQAKDHEAKKLGYAKDKTKNHTWANIWITLIFERL